MKRIDWAEVHGLAWGVAFALGCAYLAYQIFIKGA